MKYLIHSIIFCAFAFVHQLAIAQNAHLTSSTANQSLPTAYATANMRDSIFVFCTLSETPVSIGSLTAFSPTAATNYTHQWYTFNSANQTWGAMVGETIIM